MADNTVQGVATATTITTAGHMIAEMIKMEMAKLMEATAGYMSQLADDAARAARIADMHSLAERKVADAIATEYAQRAVSANTEEQARILGRAALEFQKVAQAAEQRLIEAANLAAENRNLAASVAERLGPGLAHTLGGAFAVGLAIHEIGNVIDEAEAAGLSEDQVVDRLTNEVLREGLTIGLSFSTEALAFIEAGATYGRMVLRAGGVALALSLAFEAGWFVGRKVIYNNDWFGVQTGSLDPLFRIFDFVLGIGDGTSNNYALARLWRQRRDPLVLDLDGDGIETVGINPEDPILFDLTGTGIKTAVGWIGADDGFLVLDRNGNGVIDDGRELFGDATPLSGGGAAADGIAALGDLDANGDGRIDASDPIFSELRVWRDFNQDGLSDAFELFDLDSLNITAINLTRVPGGRILSNGNQIADQATYERSDGTDGGVGTSGVADVNLAVDNFHRVFADRIPLTDATRVLPDMRGTGLVRDLREAATLSPSLAGTLQGIGTGYRSKADLMGSIDGIIAQWAATSGMQTSVQKAAEKNKRIIYMAPGQTIQELGLLHAAGGGSGSGEVISPEEREKRAQRRLQQVYITDLISLLERFNGTTFLEVQSNAEIIKTGAGERLAEHDPNAGDPFGGMNPELSPFIFAPISAAQLDLLQKSYDALKQSIYNSLVMQTRLLSYTDLLSYFSDGTSEHVDFAAMDAAFQAQFASQPADAVRDLTDMQRIAAGAFTSGGWDGYGILRGWLSDVEAMPPSPQKTALLGSITAALADSGYSGLRTNGDGTNASEVVSGSNAGGSLAGGVGNDLVLGGAGDDLLNGGSGDDILHGGAGDDTYAFNLGDGSDTVTETRGEVGTDTLQFGGGIAVGDLDIFADGEKLVFAHANGRDAIAIANWFSTLGESTHRLDVVRFADGSILDLSAIQLGTPQADRLTGSPGEDILAGGAGEDTLIGGIGNDLLNGGTDADEMDGGTGDDIYIVDNIGDVVTELEDEGTDLVYARTSVTLADNVEDLTLSLSGNFSGTGNELNNVITGNVGHNTLNGMAGDDTLRGGAGNDVLNGGTGADAMDGGTGNDRYIVDDMGDSVAEAFNEGTDVVETGLTYTLGANVENLTLTGTDSVDGTGNEQNNVILGNAGDNVLSGMGGNDTLNGGEGTDTLQGGTGNDVYVVDSEDDLVVENEGEGIDLVQASITYTLTDNVENLTLTGSEAIDGTGNVLGNVIIGNSAANVLTGLEGNDRLDGGAGIDTMAGGVGDDTYVIDSLDDVVLESAGEGTDTVEAGVTYTLLDEFENLTLIGSGNINATGNAANNVLTGNGGSNVLDGAAGADVMAGGGGDDTYLLDDLGDQVVEQNAQGTDTVVSPFDYTLGANVDNLVLTGSALTGTGNELANVIVGTAADNTLTGLGGNDTLNGGEGADTMVGGQGDDTYVVDTLADTITEAAGEGKDTVVTGLSFTLADNFENLTLTGTDAVDGTGNTADNVIIGNEASNVLTGLEGNDTLDGGFGADTMTGGTGNDTYVVDDAGDMVTEAAGEGTDLVQSSITYTLGSDVENLNLTGTASIDGTGNALDNVLNGNGGANVLSGLEGNDTLNGGAGADTLIGGTGNDTYIVENSADAIVENEGEGVDSVESSASYTLSDHVENLTLTGSSSVSGTGNALDNTITGNPGSNTLSGMDGNDTLVGGAGADTLDGGTGADAMTGGSGNDVYVVDQAGDTVAEVLAGGADEVRASISYTLGSDVEHLRLTGTDHLTGTGNELDNNLFGNSGDNTLYGMAGKDTILGDAGNDVLDGGDDADRMGGGLGDDLYIVNDAADLVAELTAEGFDTVHSSVSYTLTANVEDLTLTGSADINGTGNALDNTILGNGGANIIDGAAGADTMAGGAGHDTYVVDNMGDVVTESADEGTDLVQSGITYTLTDNVENLTLTGSADIGGTGNMLANTITGNSGANVLDGAAGADTLAGGMGDDTYVADETADAVVEGEDAGIDTVLASASYTLSDHIENLTLTGAGDIDGTGNALDNVITANSGLNTLTGLGGDDTYVVDSTDDVVVESFGEGVDEVQSSATYTLSANVENLSLTGTADIDGTGNALGNVISGNAGANTLSGLGGDDTYIIEDAADTVAENADEGVDTVESSITYTLTENVENLTLTGTADIDGTGNTQDNAIVGNSGSNVLDGAAGADSMAGGAGNDTYIVEDAGDTVSEEFGEGTDEVQSGVSHALGANVENLTLTGAADIDGTGNAQDNIIAGNSGNNLIDGGLGADAMAGGAGDDTYVVESTGDAVTESLGEGTDLVQSGISYTLTANVEDLTLTGSANIDGTGNAQDNILVGNSGANILDGAAGADAMAGDQGGDTYVVDDAGDVVTESAGEGIDLVLSSVDQTLAANVENLTLTGAADIDGTGNELANVITGNTGINTLAGQAGDDTYVVQNTADVVVENAGEGIDHVQASATYTLSADVENLTLTGSAHIDGTGNTQDNIIVGNSGNNVLDGATGADSMAGGAGNDTYIVESAGDMVTESFGEGTDLVRSSISYNLGSNVENLTLTGIDDIDGTGNALDNLITGNAGANLLDGAAGADSMAGGAGDDTYVVESAGDLVAEAASEGVDLVQSSISYTLTANVEDLTLTGSANINGTGNAQDNLILGNSGNNVLDGAAGSDSMAGGQGGDTYVVDNMGDLVSESMGEGTDLVQSSITYTLTDNVENLTLTASANIDGTGNELNNVITGNSGINTLAGLAGDDTYVVQNTADVVLENAGEGSDLVQSSATYTLGDNVENLTLTGSANIDGTGNTQGNTLIGNSGANVLDGAAGSDLMIGGAGNDTYVVESSGDLVSENPGEGTDTVRSSISYTLGANVENLTLTGGDDISGTGNTQNNVITGNSGHNLIDGAAGADQMAGGAGDDTYVVESAGDLVTEGTGEGADLVQSSISYTLTANVENLTLTGSANINGTGNGLGNIILGNSGNNVIDGAAGADQMSGGAGSDTYVVENAGDLVTENPGEGTDLVQSSISYTLTDNVENLTLTGAAAINGTGNALNNIITGNSAGNVLDGGLGTDTLIGGAGNDSFVVDNTGDVVSEAPGGGIDTVFSSVTYSLSANVENLTLVGDASADATGNELDNILIGNTSNNRLFGLGGNDTLVGNENNDLLDGGTGADAMSGNTGDDTYVVDNAGDSVTEAPGEGADLVQSSISYTLTANVENLTLTGGANLNGTGNALDNIIVGTTGANVLDGAAGADTLSGGVGNDTYVVDNIGDLVNENLNEGTDLVQSSIIYTLTANVENLTLTGTASIDGTGNALNNVITGNGGLNTLAGLGGDDTYVVQNTADVVLENAAEGTDLVQSSVTYAVGDNVENLTLTGSANIDGTGNALNNVIVGNTGNNVIDGQSGADSMSGGLGNDTYIVETAGDLVTEAASAGTDLARSSISYALTANVENLTLTGIADINGTGNALNNVIVGNTGNNLLDGAAGADQMSGGAGNDTYVVESGGDLVTENQDEGIDLVQSSISYTLTANVENLTLTGGSNINGTGNGLDNIILGNIGANVLDGAAGADAMAGGAGNDTYVVQSAGDLVTENLNEGTDLVQSSITYTLNSNVENLTLTGAANIDGTGNTLNNIITGNSGNNLIDGLAGADSMSGGLGNDTYIVENAGDTVTEAAAAGIDLVLSSVSFTLGANVENLTLTETGNINGTGNTLNNIILGNVGNNVLDGAAGADAMAGGLGNDTYVVESAGDVVTENLDEGTDLVQSSITYTLTANVENLTLTGSANINGTGNGLDNAILGNIGANVLDGAAGADSMAGGAGNDTYVVESAGDLVTENLNEGIDLVQSSITYTLTANVENLTLTGTAEIDGTGNTLNNIIIGNGGVNQLVGLGGDDTLDGGLGADAMSGGQGNDTYVVENAGDLVTENLNEGTDLVQSSITYTLTDNVENLTLTGAANIDGTGNALNNIITGNSGNNLIDGLAGADSMSGGLGNDTYIAENAGDTVTEGVNAGTDLVLSSVSFTLGANVENLTLTDVGNINGTGNTLNNIILGNTGNNVLDGAAGADSMAGGLGNDTYSVENAGDVVTENLDEGTDLVQSSITYTLTANVENLTLTGSSNINGTGNGLDNIILGNIGANVLDGAAGADSMAGGAGNDTYVVESAGDLVTENLNEGTDLVQSSITYTLTANVENLTLTGTANIDGTGNALNNIITGNSGDNQIAGLGGDDALDGGLGADAMFGGQGNDTYVVDNAGDLVTENLNEGTDLVQSSISYALTPNVENLTLTGSANIDGTGNGLANILTGNGGSNVLDGGGAADSMSGGLGNDTYVVENAGDAVTEGASAGTDLVQSSISYALTANVENLTLTGLGNVNGTGNTLNNVITGNAGNNLLDGAAGADSMAGSAGDDTYVVENAGDVVTENLNEGTDLVQSSITYTLAANVENLTLTGGGNLDGTGNALNNVLLGNVGNNQLFGLAGADSLVGNVGNDTLDGGLDGDALIGGQGDDSYVVDNIGDLVTENLNEGTDVVQSGISYALTANVENLTLTGAGNVGGTGNGLANVLAGNSGNNLLDGGGAADTMSGGLGNDTYVVENAGDTVTEAASAGTDLVLSSVSFTLGANVENLTLTELGNVSGTGNTLSNVVTGNAGNNLLDGAAGADTLAGGAGDDTYLVESAGDVVTENASQGTDLVQSSVSYTLTANVENLTLSGTASIDGTGNTLNNVLTGNSGNNVLDGGGEADLMAGGTGNDTYVVDNAGDLVAENFGGGTDLVQSSVSYALTANVENLTLTGSANVDGTGNGLANVLVGNGGDNVLDGGGAADSLLGGAGNDTYVLDNAGDTVTEGAGAGTDTVLSSVSFTLGANVENLTLTESASVNGTGNALDNVLLGNTGNNRLDGAAGSDAMAGGQGDDTYVVESAGDAVSESFDEGTDLVQSSIGYALTANVENLTLTGSAGISGTGNALGNVLTGNSGDNVLDGGASADLMAGGAGNDTYIVDDAGDLVTENFGGGTDTVLSSVNHTLAGNAEHLTLTGTANIDGFGNGLSNVLTGNSGDNVLEGGGGDDSILGGAGDDTMSGGTGHDTYMVEDAGDSVSELAGEGIDLVRSSISYTLGANVENLTLFGAGDLSGTGNTLANFISGNDGNNVLDGGAGADTMSGSFGDDTYIVDNSADAVLEGAGAGTDLVLSGATFTLGAGVENLSLTGSGSIDGNGNGLANVITGNSGNNVLAGGAGDDQLSGGAGDDSYVFNLGDGVDTIHDVSAPSAQNRIVFGTGIARADLGFSQAGNVLTIHVGSGGDALVLPDFNFSGAGGTVVAATVHFADGSSANLAELANRAPIVAQAIDDQAATEDAAFSFVVPAGTFADPDLGDPLVLSATLADGSALPEWVSFDPATRTLSGTPRNEDVGDLSVRITATDAHGLSTSDVFVVGVANTNDAPAVADPIDDQAATEDSPFTFIVPAGAFADVDLGDTLSYSATRADDSALPAWLAFDAATRTFSGTPLNGDVGAFDVRVTATDGAGASASDVFSVTVANTNDAPVAVDDSFSVDEDTGLALVKSLLVGNDFDFDPTGDTLNIVSVQNALHGSVSLNDGQMATFIPDANYNGPASFQYTISDGNGGFSTATVNLNVLPVNDAPTVADPIEDQAATEDAVFSFTVPAGTFADIDSAVLTYSAALADGSELPAWLAFDALTGTFSGTPANGDVGTLSVRVTATDGGALSASDVFDITVANTNDAPVLASPLGQQDATEDQAFSFTLPEGTFTDDDAGDTLTYSATLDDVFFSPLPAWLSFDAATRTFSGTPENGDVGFISVRVVATDQSGAAAHATLGISVANTNDAPTVASPIADQSATEDAAFSFSVPAGTFADIDAGDFLDYSATLADGSALPSWLTFDFLTRIFSGTPANGDVGSIDVRVTASDSLGAAASDVFRLTVANTNDAPTLANAIADQSATEDAPFSFVVPAGAFADVDLGDTLTYSATLDDGSVLPAWLAFDAATRTFSGTPANGDVGPVEVKVTATDAAGTFASDTFVVTVANTNDAPTLANAIADQSATEDAPFSFVVPAGAFADVDLGDTLTYSATLDDGSVLPAWLAFDAATRTFSGTPANGDVGPVEVKVTATDAAGTFASDTFVVTVANTNDVPTVANPIADQGGQADVAFSFTFAANAFADVDAGDSLSYTATLEDGSALPSWLSFDGATRTFSGTPGLGDAGLLALRVTATDADGTSASDVFNLDVVLQGTITGTEGNDVLVGTTGRDLIQGLGGDDSLSGLAGNDTLDGGTGVDTMTGGTGDDTYIVDSAGDVVTESAGQGSDTVMSSITHTLAANVENLTLTGASAINGTGNSLDNVITGNEANNALNGVGGNDQLFGGGGNDTLTGSSGNDILDGGIGADTMNGGTGNDIFFVDNVGDVVIEASGDGNDTVKSTISYTLGSNIGTLVLLGEAAINGTGNSLDNTITGNAANNVLDGGSGGDTLIGGAGDDTYVVNSGGDTVVEGADAGIDLVSSSASHTLAANVENLTLTGSSGLSGTGNSLDNVLTGNTGNNTLTGGGGDDTLVGGGGSDTLRGGTGNDSYVVNSGGDVVTEFSGEGTDTVSSSISYTLGSNVENLTLTGGSGLSGTGNSLDNVLTGNTGNNTLTGSGGNDTLIGGGGTDTLRGGTGNDSYLVDSSGDIVTENSGEGTDTVNSSITWTLGSNLENLTLTGSSAINGTGNTLANLLTGNGGDNTLMGLAGNDTLDGGAGSDTLAGGTGNDTYVLGRGYGAELVQENDSTAGNADVGSFLDGIATDQIWFQHVGNDLVASIIGTSDRYTVQNWYSGSAFHLEQFRTADGQTLLDSQVQNLVDAMAAFAPPGAGETTLPPSYAAALNPVIAANWN